MARILIVDDCPFVRRALERVVSRDGHDVISTGNPAGALQLVLEHRPHVVTLDFEMPRMNGDKVYRLLRASLREACPPVIFISGRACQDVAAALPADAERVEILAKPFTTGEVSDAVKRYVGTTS